MVKDLKFTLSCNLKENFHKIKDHCSREKFCFFSGRKWFLFIGIDGELVIDFHS